MPFISDQEYEELQRLKAGRPAGPNVPAFRPPVPAWQPPAYQQTHAPGWSATMAGAPQPGMNAAQVMALGYGNDQERARYQAAEQQLNAALPINSAEQQQAISLQGVQNPDWYYDGDPARGNGVWRYKHNGGSPPPGAREAFSASWQQIGRSNPDMMGLDRDAQGYAIDSWGNRIPGTQKAPQQPQAPAGPPTASSRVLPDGTTVNMPLGTPLADGSYADGKGGTFRQAVGANVPTWEQQQKDAQPIPGSAQAANVPPAAPPPVTPPPPAWKPPVSAGVTTGMGMGIDPTKQPRKGAVGASGGVF